jgi:hypothetical protein
MSDAAETLPISFTMTGCRDVLTHFAGSIHIERQIVLIEQNVAQNPRLAFDLCKATIETTCKTVLRERGIEPESADNVQDLLKQALNHLDILPDSHRDRPKVRDGLKKTLNGLKTVVQGLAEIRNDEGFASHGPDAFAPSLDTLHALMAARATDAIVHFLVGCHRAFPRSSGARRLEYADNQTFNDYVDDLHGLIRIFESQYKPSEVLFELDDVAYTDALKGYQAELEAEQAARTPEPAGGVP